MECLAKALAWTRVVIAARSARWPLASSRQELEREVVERRVERP
jgi:hypothetical protein